jgi:hypothetical protein
MTCPDDFDSAMETGSDAGEPGPHLGRRDLTPDEMRLLAELEREGGRGEDEEGSEEMARAAEDEAPLPAQGGDQGDGLSARFAAPPED